MVVDGKHSARRRVPAGCMHAGGWSASHFQPSLFARLTSSRRRRDTNFDVAIFVECDLLRYSALEDDAISNNVAVHLSNMQYTVAMLTEGPCAQRDDPCRLAAACELGATTTSRDAIQGLG